MIIDPADNSNSRFYRYMTAAVAPRPICFAATVDAEGRPNLSPFSYFNAFSTTPPILIFSPALRGRDGTTKDTLDNVLAVPECTISMVRHSMVEQMSLSSAEYPTGVNEFEKAGFTAVPSERVKPPRVGEAPVSFECVVDRVIPLGDRGGAGNLVIARVVLMHIDDAYLDKNGHLDNQKMDLVGRMGGSDYVRASGAALFTIPKPTQTIGIGVDALPKSARESTVLTGNELGRLGSAEGLPEPELIGEIREQVLRDMPNPPSLEQLHRRAQSELAGGARVRALAYLWVGEELIKE